MKIDAGGHHARRAQGNTVVAVAVAATAADVEPGEGSVEAEDRLEEVDRQEA